MLSINMLTMLVSAIPPWNISIVLVLGVKMSNKNVQMSFEKNMYLHLMVYLTTLHDGALHNSYLLLAKAYSESDPFIATLFHGKVH